MAAGEQETNNQASSKYLTSLGAWALAFGCSVGWGAFVMPGTTFLPLAGPIGTLLGIAAGGAAMLIIGVNYHYLINQYPDNGGSYAYTKISYGYDHGFLSAWFLILTYIAILWANASALPLIARTVLGRTFQFGFDYEIAGYHVYMGEILLAACALVISAFVCLKPERSQRTQIAMALLLLFGVACCLLGAMAKQGGDMQSLSPAFAPEHNAIGGVFTVFALAPWAFVGFESISHSAAEARFPLKRSFGIMAIAIAAGAAAYIALALLAVFALPEGCASWPEYIGNLGRYQGLSSQPTFFAAHASLGNAGTFLLGLASLCAIFTGLIGNYIALSRLLCALSDDGILSPWIGKRNQNQVPQNAILCILGISIWLPFLGRTAISWIVDVTTVGATIAYAFTAASAWKKARENKNAGYMATGFLGLIISVLFALEFLIPNMLSVDTLSTESYLILAAWGILGFVVFRCLLGRDKERRMGRSIVAWVVLLGLIIFTSNVWMRQMAASSVEKSAAPIQSYYEELLGTPGDDGSALTSESYPREILRGIGRSLNLGSVIQILLIVMAMLILLDIYSLMQKREKQIEVEKALAEESSRAKTSFLSNMSHEIRTPMNAIIGLDNIALRDPDLPPRTREQLEKIGLSARHLLSLINDILDMSRIESGRMVLKSEEFAFREFLEQINVIINGQCSDKGLQYECQIVGRVSDYYCGDDMKLKQVLINILGNSVKFTEAPGTVTLTVEQIAEFEGRCTLRFTMTDTGIGMDKDFIPKLFEAFSQEDDTATNSYGGSGLGMAITRNYVEMMNGDIQVESEKGKGSTFIVTVTLKASTQSGHASFGLPEGLRAMILDDDVIACEHTQVVMRAIGIEADITTDPHEAIRRIREALGQEEPYAFFLTDYKMPVMNGMEAAGAVRAFDDGRTAIIMLTGYSHDFLEAEAKESGIDGILDKPVFSDSLVRELQVVLARKDGFVIRKAEKEEEDKIKQSLSGCRILMAEDVEQNAEILQDLLELEDIISEWAKNGEIAVKMFEESPAGYYDAILMDVRMPVLDGLSATRAIRALSHPDAKTIPIIAMTANVFDEDVALSLQAGMNAHLSKPIEPEWMFDTLAKFIARKEPVPD